MPLVVDIIRDGKSLRDTDCPEQEWFYYYSLVNAMYTAAIKEGNPYWQYNDKTKKTMKQLPPFHKDGVEYETYVDFEWVPIYYLSIRGVDLIEKGVQTLEHDHKYFFSEELIIELKAGDELRAWREMK